MKTVGVICEWNPLHNGHKYFLDEARRSPEDTLVCVMSGNFVQRGEAALTECHRRSEMALDAGADLVLELPFPWSAAGAEFFGSAGVAIAEEMCDELVFGSESGDLDALRQTAQKLEDDSFWEELDKALREGEGTARAFRHALGGELCANDILGVSYLRAMERAGSKMTPRTLLRHGTAYGEQSLREGEYPSATAIRCALREHGISAVGSYVPASTLAHLYEAERLGELSDPDRILPLMQAFFRLHEPPDFEGIAEAGGGLAQRICAAARSADTPKAFFESLRTKRYTDSRLRRAMIFCMTGVTMEDLRSRPAYCRILAANEKGRALLAAKRREGGLPLLAKGADIPHGGAAERQLSLSLRADGLFAMSCPRGGAADFSLKTAPVMRREEMK